MKLLGDSCISLQIQLHIIFTLIISMLAAENV